MSNGKKLEILYSLLTKSKEIKTEHYGDAVFGAWRNSVERGLVKIFGKDSLEVKQLTNLKFTYTGSRWSGVDYSAQSLGNFRRSMAMVIQAIESYIEEFKEQSDINDSSAISLPTATEIDKIFISHSSLDKYFVEEMIDILETIGIKSHQIFCTSFAGYGAEFGENFLTRIKDELDDNVLVIFILSDNFYESPVCLCEMGATWMRTNHHIPVLMPKFEFNRIRGVIPNTHGFKIDDKDALNQLKVQLEQIFNIDGEQNFSTWERKRDRIIGRINKIS